MTMGWLPLAALLARTAHAPLLALPPGCGADCAGLAEHDTEVVSVIRPGLRCKRSAGLSGGILHCSTASSDGARSVFAVDPDDPVQLSHILADGALTDEGMVSNWLERLDADTGLLHAAAHELPESNPSLQRPPAVTTAWLRECGCSGLHREATHFVAPLSRLFARDANSTRAIRRTLRDRFFTNACLEDCGFSAETKALIDAVAVPIASFWRMAELALRRCGARVGQLRAFEHLNAQAKRQWGCTTQSSPALQLVVHIGPAHSGGGPCVWPEAARWLRQAPNVVTISRTMFEVDGVPAEAVKRCNQYDEVWVPASFNLQTFHQSGVSLQRLRSIPEGFDPAIFHAKTSAEIDTRVVSNVDHGSGSRQARLIGAVDWAKLALEARQEGTGKGSQVRTGTSGHGQQYQEDITDREHHVDLPAEIRRFITDDLVRRRQTVSLQEARSPRKTRSGAMERPNRRVMQPVPGESAAADVRPQHLFLSVFKWEARKGWQELLAAFWAEFLDPLAPTVAPPVRLIIKTSMPLPPDKDQLHHSDRPVHQVAAWAWELGYDVSAAMAMVLIYEGMLSSEELGSLYRAADSFVLATHGEGWGLPLLESMACGLPTIATAWGGHTDFMTDGRGILVGIEEYLVPAPPKDFGVGFKWAQPRHDLLRQALRTVSEQGNETKAMARRGWAWVHDQLQHEHVAQLAMRMLERTTREHRAESSYAEPSQPRELIF